MTAWRVLPHRDSKAHLWRRPGKYDADTVRAACGIIDSTEAGPLAVDESAPRCRLCAREMDPDHQEQVRAQRIRARKHSGYSPVGSRAYHVAAKRSPG